MDTIASFIQGSQKVTDIFGGWPSFHDAEVVELSLWRGEMNPATDDFVYPTLTVKIHHWEMTPKVDDKGYYVLEKHTLTTFRFHRIDQLRLDEFNHQNVIYELLIEQREPVGHSLQRFTVQFIPSFGIGASFICSSVEILDATPRPDLARPHSSHPPTHI